MFNLFIVYLILWAWRTDAGEPPESDFEVSHLNHITLREKIKSEHAI